MPDFLKINASSPTSAHGNKSAVESFQLAQFINQIVTWPKSQSELDEVTDQIAKIFGATFISIFTTWPMTAAGIKFSGPIGAESTNPEKFLDFLKAQLKPLLNDTGEIKQTSLSRNGSAWPLPLTVQHLTCYPIQEINKKVWKHYGFVTIGTSKPLDTKEDLAHLITIAQRLGSLARIAELELELSIRSQSLSIASHELKTPLTSIYGILQLQERMLRAKKDQPLLPDQERHHNFLKMVLRQVERLNELIDGLLDVSRIQSGRFVVEPSDTDVATLLKDCIQGRLNMIAQEAGVKMQLDTDSPLLAWVDPVRMEEVISNLVMNGIRFSPEGGVIWIRLRKEKEALRLTVRDQGPSIPLEDRERIFQPFERAQRTSRLGGLGLGLFISRQIAQLHGGNVSLIESVPGKGNVFEGYFPVREATH